MKIGILTYHYSDNYGALLQTYALSKILEDQGYEVEIINLVPKLNIIRKVRKFFKDPLTKNFKKFRKENLKIYPKKTFNYDEIGSQDFSSYDAVIVGSDQVWRKGYTEGLGYSYFLDFVPVGIKRIAYAASFGLDYYEGDKNDVEKIKKELLSFNLITNREQSGVKICQDLFNVESHCVLDPVLLSDDVFDNFLKPEIGTPYVTQYLLDPTIEKLKLIKRISTFLKCKIVINYKQSNKKITLLNSIFNKKQESFPPVHSWINRIKFGQFIVTDSFHGVAFSILFKKQFICIVNEYRGKTRMINLLDQLGLLDRAYFENELCNINIEELKPIDYIQLNFKLKTLRIKSLDLLLNSIKE